MPDTNPNLSRHARHLALAQVGADGQERISSSTALLIGVGGIGCAAASYLAASGVGNLLLCDFDRVDATNLGRQFLYGPEDIGELKARQAAASLTRINPDIQISAITERLAGDALASAVANADVVLDGSDNFATRFQVNDACVTANTCLISGAAIRFEGQIAEFGPDYATSPCYRCLYREAVPGTIGSLMAVEALKFLAGIESPRGILRLFDAASGEFRTLAINKRDDCPSCG